MEFEPTIPASERAKTVHALDRSATVTALLANYYYLIIINSEWYNKPKFEISTLIFYFNYYITKRIVFTDV
jgi:hypothetical protein